MTRQVSTVAAELAVAALSVVAVLNVQRLFSDSGFLAELLTVALLAHVEASVARRAGLRTWLAAPLTLAVSALAVKLLLYPETGLSPEGLRETFSLLGDDLALAWDLFQAEKAPVEPVRGLVAVAAATLAVGALVADWAAFRLRSVFETLIPASAVFAFASLLSTDNRQVAYGAMFAASVAAMILAARASRRADDEVWVADEAARGVASAAAVGAVTMLTAVTLGAVVGPSVPGAGEPIVDVSDLDDRPAARAVLSPLVEIGTMLVDQSNFELFSVSVDPADRDYWRLMALTEFDGAVWRRHSSFRDVRGPVPTGDHDNATRRIVRQEITTRRLGNVYLPAAFELHSVVDSGEIVLEYEASTGALVVDRDSAEAAARGFSYVVESAVPGHDPTLLPAVAAEGADGDLAAEHTRLPPPCADADDEACWPERVTALARQVTESATTDYERALALQAFFAGPGSDFSYDLAVARSHDIATISDFLFGTRRGYCEQFATAFAAMARSLGIPSRVAVGFTWGDWDAGRGEYVVKGRHAHAWAELYFAEAGWIVFDPTPGRGPAHGISGLAPAQHGDSVVAGAGEVVVTPPGTVPSFGADRPDAGSGLAAPPSPPEASGGEAAVVPVAEPGPSRAARILARAAVAGAAAAALVLSVPTAKRLLRRRRLRAAAGDPVASGELAYDDAVEALRLVGIEPAAHETPLEFARRAQQAPLDPGPLRELAEAITVLRYWRAEVDPAAAAQRAAATIRGSCRAAAGRRRVLLALLDPRTLRLRRL